MSEQWDRANQGWAKFLNPEALRGNLIVASIFLAAYERLRTSVIDRIRAFFTHGFDENGPIVSEEYKSDVLTLDKSPLRASLFWLQKMSAIDETDIARVDRVREHRNELAHDLPRFIATADAEINIHLLEVIYDLVAKIDRWWVREVEIPTNPDFDGQEVNDSDIQSGNMLFIQMMIQIATGKDSGAYWEEFQKQAGRIFSSTKGSA
jgi:hypothetical protein